MKKVEFEIGGQRVQGAVARVGSTTWYSLGGEVWTVETESRTSRGAKSAGGNANQIAAPMPGKIIKTLRAAGDTVRAGETVVVMEAMKMEYTLKAAADGVIEKISCEVGQQVTLGSVLATLKTAESKTANQKEK